MLSSAIPDDDALRAILAAVETLCRARTAGTTPASYDSVGLAIIAAVWSIGVRYQSVENVIARYRAERLAGGGDPEADRPEDVRRFIEACGGAEEFAQRVGNRQRTSTTQRHPQGRGGAARGPHPRGRGRGAYPPTSPLPARSAWTTCSAAGRRSPGRASGVSWRAFSHARRPPRGQAGPHDPPLRRRRPRTTRETAVGVDEARDLVHGRRGAPRRVAPRTRQRHLDLSEPTEGPTGIGTKETLNG